MPRYSFGALSDLTDIAISDAIPSVAPVNQHVSVLNNQTIVHPTLEAVVEADPTFAVAIDSNSTSANVLIVPATVIQDTVAFEPSTDSSNANPTSATPIIPGHTNPYITAAVAPANSTVVTRSNLETAPTTTTNQSIPSDTTDTNSNSVAATSTNPNTAATTMNFDAVASTSTSATNPDATTTNPDATTTNHVTTATPTVMNSNTAGATTTAGAETDPALGVASMDRATSPSGKTLSEVIPSLREAPLTTGCALAANSSACTRSYTQKKKKLFIEFVEAL